MLKTKKLTEVHGKEVYTDAGEYFGIVEESILGESKVFGWKIRATKGSYLSKIFGGAKGVIVPHRIVRAIGDVMIISKPQVQPPEEALSKELESEIET
jgi:sporulation protein YlmC with PRC-barrel domain